MKGNDGAKIISEIWARQLMPSYKFQHELLRCWEDELRWLQKSLEDDMLPDWCIEMVMERWTKDVVDEWTHR